MANDDVRTPRLRATEYGGSDTQRTLGIQPAPHQLTASETLRVVYAEDPLNNEQMTTWEDLGDATTSPG